MSIALTKALQWFCVLVKWILWLEESKELNTASLWITAEHVQTYCTLTWMTAKTLFYKADCLCLCGKWKFNWNILLICIDVFIQFMIIYIVLDRAAPWNNKPYESVVLVFVKWKIHQFCWFQKGLSWLYEGIFHYFLKC